MDLEIEMYNGVSAHNWLGTAMTAARSAAFDMSGVYDGTAVNPEQDLRDAEKHLVQALDELRTIKTALGIDETEESTAVYECWVTGKKQSFVKFRHSANVTRWVEQQLGEGMPGERLNVGVHSASEYTPEHHHDGITIDPRD